MPARDPSTSVRAVVRVRPLLPHELDKGDQSCCEVQDENTVLIRSGLAGNNWRQYAFDACVPPAHSQKQFFQECGVTSLLESAVQGYSATVLAYGQTGSGKTHTMMGRHCSELASKHDEGLIIRSAKRIFRIIMGAKGDGGAGGTPSNTSSCYTVRASFTEIFNAPGAVNECICDLLSPEARNLQVRHDKRFGFYLTDVSVVDCRSSSDVRAVLEAGLQNRRIGAHQLNKDSSRSHALFSLYIDHEEPREGAGPSSTGGPPLRRHGKITFVDLAGSERLKESCAEGNARKETQAINKSLFTLGQVISMLAEGTSGKHVPYRNSKLTQLLQDSFGGEALCLMVTCISPAHAFAEESLNSCNYAQKAMNIRNRPIVRLDERQKVVKDLKEENSALKRELEAYRAMFGVLSPDVLAKFANTGGVLPLGCCPTVALEGAPQQQQTLGPAAAAVARAAAVAGGAAAGTPAAAPLAPAAAQDAEVLVQEVRVGSRLSSKQSVHGDTPRSASCGRPRGGPDAGKDPGTRRSVSASETSGKKARAGALANAGAAELVPPPAKPQRPPVPAATSGGYACAAVKRRIQPEPPAQPQRQSGAARQEAPRRELPPLPGSRGSPTRVAATPSPAGGASAHGASPGAASKMIEVAQPKFPAPLGGLGADDCAAPGSRATSERPNVPTLKAPPSKKSLAAVAAAAGQPASPSPAALQAEASAREAAGIGGSPIPLRSTLARTNSSDHVAHLTRKQLDHLDALHASEWQFDFGRPRHSQQQRGGSKGVSAKGGRGSRRGSISDDSSRALSAERQSSCDGRGSRGRMRGTQGLDSVDTSAGSGGAADTRRSGGGGRGQEVDGRSEASGQRRRGSTGSGSRDGTSVTGSSGSTSASSSRSRSASPSASVGEDTGDGGPGQAMRNLSLSELNAKLASMQMATVALMQPAKA